VEEGSSDQEVVTPALCLLPISAYLHVVHRRRQGTALLWILSLGLVIVTVLGGLSLGIIIPPGTLTSRVTAITETWRSAARGLA
jgi:hypothetical protein